MTLSVVMPAFNEENTIETIVRRVLEIPFHIEIVIVNDGSTDGTRQILERLAKEDSRIRVVHQENSGKTAALRKGFALTTVAVDAANGHLSIGRAVVLAQAVLGAAVLGQYKEGHWLLSECVRALSRIEEVEAENARKQKSPAARVARRVAKAVVRELPSVASALQATANGGSAGKVLRERVREAVREAIEEEVGPK